MKNLPVKIPSCSECDSKNIFDCLPQNEMEKLSVNKDNNFFKKGQVIFYEGNHPHGMYCIILEKLKFLN